MVNGVPNRNETATATIASGQSLSDVIDLSGRNLTGILLPAAWTAADLTFSVSIDGVTYADLYDETGEYALVVGASVFSGINIAPLMGFRYLKVRSGTSASPVNQTADRDLVLTLGDFTR